MPAKVLVKKEQVVKYFVLLARAFRAWKVFYYYVLQVDQFFLYVGMVLFKSGYAVIRFPVAVVQRLYVWEYRFFFVFQVLGHFVPVLVEKTGHNVRFVAGIAFNHIGQMPAYVWNTVSR